MIIISITDPQYFAPVQQDFSFDGSASSISDPEYLDQATQLDVEPWGFTELTFLEPPPPPPPPGVIASIEEGSGSGFNQMYDGNNFISPYNNGSTVAYDDSDGYDGYNFEIRKDSDLVLGEITISTSVDGYNGPMDVGPEPNSYDVRRDSVIRFRVRRES